MLSIIFCGGNPNKLKSLPCLRTHNLCHKRCYCLIRSKVLLAQKNHFTASRHNLVCLPWSWSIITGSVSGDVCACIRTHPGSPHPPTNPLKDPERRSPTPHPLEPRFWWCNAPVGVRYTRYVWGEYEHRHSSTPSAMVVVKPDKRAHR